MKNSNIAGAVLIIFGIIILLHEGRIDIFDWENIRSYGFILIGLFFFARSFSFQNRRGIFLGTFLIIMGGYFLLGLFGWYNVTRGLNFTVTVLAIGASCYSLYLFKNRNLTYLLYGNIVLLIGFFFLLEYMGKLPPYLLVTAVDKYWPILLIIAGLGFLLQGTSKRKST